MTKNNELDIKLGLIDKLFQVKKIASNNFFYFVKNIIGFKEITMQTHGKLCDIITNQKSKKRKLILLPRGTFKTSVCTISYPIYKLIHQNPNVRVLISSDTYDNATKCLFKIKNILETNEHLKSLHGDLKGKRWREDEIDISLRTVNHKEPSISCGSQDVTKVGQHYELIILDDIVTDVNTQTKEQMEKTLDYFRSLFSILEPGGELIVVGTRWSYSASELYQYIMENLKDQFEILVKGAFDNNGKLFFPERLNKDTLDELKKLQGSFIFNSQYLNEPISPEDQLFKKITLYENYSELPKDLYISITIDPAISLEARGDDTGIVICGTDERECMYVLETINSKFRLDELIDTVFFLNNKWKPNIIGLETVAYQKSLKYYLEMDELKRKTYLPLMELKTDNRKSKFMRIQALQPYFERGQLRVMSNQNTLLEQLRTYPKSTHDDLVDALAYQLQLSSKPFVSAEEIQDEYDKYIEMKKMGKAFRIVKSNVEDY